MSPALRDLQIRLNPTGAAFDRTTELPLAQLLMTLSDDVSASFTSLQALEIFPTHLPEGLAVLRTALARSAETLTRVSIRDRSLQLEELREIATVLGRCEKLEVLRFNLSRLDIDVVDLLAGELPKLKRLSILIDESRNIVEPSIAPVRCCVPFYLLYQHRTHTPVCCIDIGCRLGNARLQFMDAQ